MSSKIGRNKTLVPEARQGLNKLKTEIASEIGLSNYENVDKRKLSSRENGNVGGLIGGYMVKHMIEDYERKL